MEVTTNMNQKLSLLEELDKMEAQVHKMRNYLERITAPGLVQIRANMLKTWNIKLSEFVNDRRTKKNVVIRATFSYIAYRLGFSVAEISIYTRQHRTTIYNLVDNFLERFYDMDDDDREIVINLLSEYQIKLK